MKHYLKTWPEYYKAVVRGQKKFELRVNDRGFQVGDVLVLQEYDPETKTYTGQNTEQKVTYMIQGQFGLPENVCVMSFGYDPDVIHID